MKQTNNAIKFLMAQYRAIFKNAYFKGLTTAVVLSAGMAAGAANAALPNSPAWSWSGDFVGEGTQVSKVTTAIGNGDTGKAVAGSIYKDATNKNEGNTENYITGGNLILGTGGHATALKDDTGKDANAYGGYAKLTKDGDVLIDTNTVTVNNGLTVSGAAIYGGFGTAQKGSITAQNNRVDIKNAKLTYDGNAKDQFIMGAKVFGRDGATVENNHVVIQGADNNSNVFVFQTNNQIGGGHATDTVKTSGSEQSTGDFKSIGNTITITNAKYDKPGTAEKFIIFGGRSFLNNAQSKATSAISSDNKVEITDAIFNTNTTSSDLTGSGIVGNIAAIKNHTGSADVKASGEENGNVALTLTRVTITNESADKPFQVAGGYAYTNNGSATADHNIVNITDSELTKVDLFGGYASGAGANATITASNNSLTLESTKTGAQDSPITISSGSITGANLALTGAATATNKLTADNNSLTIGQGYEIKDTDTFGVKIDVNTTDSSVVQAENINVNLDAKYTNSTGSNKTIAAVFVTNSATGQLSGANTNYAKIKNNSITIGENADISGYDIAAVTNSGSSQGIYALATNNDVTIKGKVKNGDIIGGAGADSLVSLESTGKLIYNKGTSSSSTGTSSIISDNTNIAGTVQIGTYDTLQLKGYYVNGNAKSPTSYNISKTDFASTAQVYNKGTLEFFGQTTVADGAKLHAMVDGAKLIVNGDSGSTTIDGIIADTDTPVDLVGGRGSLKISSTTLKSYLTSDEVKSDLYSGVSKDSAGIVKVTSGGVLEFSDESVVLSKFDFETTETSANGKILVDSSTASNNGSYIKGNHLILEHKLAKNATTATDLSGLTALAQTAGVNLEANVLTLGSNKLSQDQSKDILFKSARVKDEINFQVASGSYQLMTAVEGTNYKIETNPKDESKYYVAQNGKINGDVTILGDDSKKGILAITDGNWTANNTITVASSGTLTVGGTSKAPKIENPTSNPDATLTTSKLVLDVASTGDATVTVSGSSTDRYDYDYAQTTLGDDRFVMLDATKGLSLKTGAEGAIAGKATLEATSGGVVRLSGSDVSNILKQNSKATATSGAFFTAKSGGAFEVTGTLDAQFSDFNSSSSTNNGFKLEASNSPTHDGGTLKVDTLNITHQNDASKVTNDSSYNKQVLNIGGTVQAQSFNINDFQQTKDKDGKTDVASSVVLANGSVEISKNLSSVNNKLVLGDNTNSAHLVFATDANENSGSISVNNIELKNGSSVKATVGNWDASKTTFNLTGSGSLAIGGDSFEDINGNDTEVSFNAAGIVLGHNSAKLTVATDGKASFNSFDISKAGAGKVSVSGQLLINGDSAAKKADGSADPSLGINFGKKEGVISIENNGHVEFSTQATHAAILAEGAYTTNTITFKDQFGKIENKGGVLQLDFTNKTSFNADSIKALKNGLFTSSSLNNGVLVSGGVLNIGNAQFSGYDNKLEANTGTGLSGYKVEWSQVSDFSDIYGTDVTNKNLSQTNVYGVKFGEDVRGHWGSFSLDNGDQASIAGHTSLGFASGNNGFFISDSTHSQALGATIQGQKSLTLKDGGKIGKITLQQGASNDIKNLTKLEIQGGGTTLIDSIETQDTNSTYVNVNANTEVANSIKGLAYLDIDQKGSLKVKQDVVVKEISTLNSQAQISGTLSLNEADIIGGLIDSKSVELGINNQNSTSYNISIVNSGELKTDTLTVSDKIGSTGFIKVGSDNLPEDGMYQDVKVNGTGYLEVGTAELNGATLVVDPAYGSKASISSIMKFRDNKNTYAYQNDAGVINGNIWIGKNAVQSIGATKEATLVALKDYFDSNGSLDQDKYGSILYLNGQVKLIDGSEIALNAHNEKDEKTITDTIKYTKNSQTLFADLGLGKNTAILMTEQAFENDKGERTGTAVYFDKSKAVVNGAGGEIILSGDFDAASKLNIFNDKDQNGVDVEGSIAVRTENGFLYTTLTGENQGYGVQLEVDHSKAKSIMSDASDPVVATLISYHEDRIAKPVATPDTDKKDPEQTKANGTDTTIPATPIQPIVTPTKITGYSDFLNEVIGKTSGAAAESAARLSVYGGVMQAAYAAQQSTSDAIAARMGIGNNFENISFASNGQGGSLWLSPVYKSQESSSLGAQGLNYGVDLNMYGLSLGGDFELSKGFRLGGAINIGSGDADGKGNLAASNTSNDFNYFGFAVYGGYSYDAFTVSADLSYTILDSDLESKTDLASISKLTASTDTNALSLGVTGKYSFKSESGLEIAPHLGLRYTRLDMDSYSIKGNTDVAHFDATTMNILSIPVGVTIAKEFEGESWTVKPSLDLTITANTGDKDIDGVATWTGVNNLETHTSSEFMDNFTYGASLGLSATNGSFSMGVGVNYTGSSNTDEFGVSANARFTF